MQNHLRTSNHNPGYQRWQGSALQKRHVATQQNKRRCSNVASKRNPTGSSPSNPYHFSQSVRQSQPIFAQVLGPIYILRPACTSIITGLASMRSRNLIGRRSTPVCVWLQLQMQWSCNVLVMSHRTLIQIKGTNLDQPPYISFFLSCRFNSY